MKVRRITLSTLIITVALIGLEAAVYIKIVHDKNAILERLSFDYGHQEKLSQP